MLKFILFWLKAIAFDDDEEGSLDGDSIKSTGTSTQTQTLRQDKQKIDELKKLEKQLNDDIKNIDDGGK